MRGDLTEGFLRDRFGELIHGGAYFRNFTVSTPVKTKNVVRLDFVVVFSL